jgi:hypothetical protein
LEHSNRGVGVISLKSQQQRCAEDLTVSGGGGGGEGGEDLDKVITRKDSERFDDGTATNRAVRLVKY